MCYLHYKHAVLLSHQEEMQFSDGGFMNFVSTEKEVKKFIFFLIRLLTKINPRLTFLTVIGEMELELGGSQVSR